MKEIVCISTYPPRECGIATFSDDLVRALHQKFAQSYSIRVCAVESTSEHHTYTHTVRYKLNTSYAAAFEELARTINTDEAIGLVCIQHEFGLYRENQEAFLQMVKGIKKPVVIVFHTVLSHPDKPLKEYVEQLINACQAVVVMTQTSSTILSREYGVKAEKINIIPHGTHLVAQMDKRKLKEKYGFTGRKILSTFGLLSPGKSIETTLEALPAIVAKNLSVLFLIIGKTHPSVSKIDGEAYRDKLKERILELNLTHSVRFVNFYLDLPVLLEYLQMTNVYLFTSSDPNQAVSGTFVYALSCGCPIIATPIPHAQELLQDKTGLIFDFKDAVTNRLLSGEKLRTRMGMAGIRKMAVTSWQNSAIAYARLFKKITESGLPLIYSLPPLKVDHIKRMSRHFGIIQFARGNRPDIRTGYTLDDNARALMALCRVYVETKDLTCGKYIKRYLDFIKYCLQPDGSLLNYVDKAYAFTGQNREVLLEDSNGRAIHALGYFIFHGESFLYPWTLEATQMLRHALPRLHLIESPRSMAFTIKGLCYFYRKEPSPEIYLLIRSLAGKLVKLYKDTASDNWKWFETYLTYDNSLLPESLLYAWEITEEETHKEIAKESFDFLLEKTCSEGHIKVISNQGWMHKERTGNSYGEQPVDVAGTVMALATFYKVFPEPRYRTLQHNAFSWFLGNNHLHQIIYNPVTGGCHDGLEEYNINLNQGAESTVSYLMVRLSLLE